MQFKMPDDLRYLESTMREHVAKQVARGKVECRIQVQPLETGSTTLTINQDLVNELVELNRKWRKKHDGLGKLTVADILKFQGVLISQNEDEEQFAQNGANLIGNRVKRFYCRA